MIGTNRFPLLLTKQACLATLLAGTLISNAAADTPIYPLTIVKVSILQWQPTKGLYEPMVGLDGQYIVSDSGSLVLPIAGSIAAKGLDAGALAAQIAARVQKRTGLVAAPDTTVEVVAYPPVYLMGPVQRSGEVGFRPGMTVLQALAAGGGKMAGRSTVEQAEAADAVKMLSEDVLRAKARIARLEAERDGRTSIASEDAAVGGNSLAAQIYGQENRLIVARRDEIERQSKSLVELQTLLDAEISTLQEKAKNIDASSAASQRDLVAIGALVQKGIALPSRQSELERIVANYRTDRLDLVTAMMRARQQQTEAQRNLDGLMDARQTSIANELQATQANLGKLTVQLEAAQRNLLQSVATENASGNPLSFVLTRQVNGKPIEMTATESTTLIPGDVLTVRDGEPIDAASMTQSTADDKTAH